MHVLSSQESRLLARLKAGEFIEFSETIDVIDTCYIFKPTAFSVGMGDDQVKSVAGSNTGSCKILAFSALHQLSPAETLSLFGHYYHHDVLNHPTGVDHPNIRAFMRHGTNSLIFDHFPLVSRSEDTDHGQ